MKKNIGNSEHYVWGNDCDGWRLVNTDSLSVIQEKMPPNTSENIHYHNNSQQFFYVLQGTASMQLKDESIVLNKGDGFHIKPGIKHQIRNDSDKPLFFLVISEPTTLSDRIEEPF
ncbi:MULTISPECIES: cupin domain-containing protein [Flavobacteriaceae]|uniref:cupin domain-containing protein n=1 Tax=Flavobacteriaceae TaxID=49546 RepID=UPI00149124E9|nr:MULTISPECIES: cupin domain-containing protein [Allomuricauda]MDC6366640.1 cupin domain-containing protein [Muricauda sp. AC10]